MADEVNRRGIWGVLDPSVLTRIVVVSPHFDDAALEVLNEFRATAFAYRNAQLIAAFPEYVVANMKSSAWHSPAVCLYRNWLQFIASKRRAILAPPPKARVGLNEATDF